MSISERVLEVEVWVIERVGADIEDMGNSDVSPVTRLRVLNNGIKRMLNDTISGLLAGDLVSAVLEFRVCERAGSRSFVA